MDALTIVITLISLNLLLIIFFWKQKQKYWNNEGLTTPKFSSFIGHFTNVILRKASYAECLQDIYIELKSKNVVHGGIYCLFIPIYYVLDLDIIKKILFNDFEHFTDRGLYFNEKSDPLSMNIFNLEGKKWRSMRSKLTPAFTSVKIKAMFEIFDDCSKKMNEVIAMKEGAAVDVKELNGCYTTDSVGRCAFGIDCNSLENPESEFKRHSEKLFEKSALEHVAHLLMFAFPNFMRKLGANSMSIEMNNFFMNMVKETVNYREKNKIFRKDLMHLLIELKNKGILVDDETLLKAEDKQNRITMEDVAAQAFVFFVAGYETSSTTISFCLYELAINKDIQTKLRTEIQKILNKSNGELTCDAVNEMSYLHKVINETLRKYPPSPSLNRKCTKDYKIPSTDIVLKKGVRVIIPVYAIQNDPNFYPNPDKFDPERFSEDCVERRHPCAFLPFGDGPRICIGMRMGILQIEVAVINLLKQFEIELDERTSKPLKIDPNCLILVPEGGVWLKFNKI